MHPAAVWRVADNREVMTSWSSPTVACAASSALSIVEQAIFEPSWHITWLLVCGGPLAVKSVLYGPVVLTGFFLLLPCPPPLLFISPSFQAVERLARGEKEEGKDGSSARCKSIPPGRPASDARPHGPLTCCLLWFMAAGGLWPLQTPLLALLRFPSHTLRECKEPHTLHHRLQEYPKRDFSPVLSCGAGAHTSTASHTVSCKNKPLHKHSSAAAPCPAIPSHVR